MLKKTISYIDFAGNQVEEDHYFNLSKAELAEMEIGAGEDGFGDQLQKLVQERDGKKIIAAFKNIILKSYGKRSEDGKRFIKSDEMALEFSQTEAYSELFVSLVTDPKESARFVEGVLPREVVEKAKTQQTVELPEEQPAWVRDDREPTNKELTGMTQAQLVQAMRRRAEREAR